VARPVRQSLAAKRQLTRDKTLEAARDQFSRNRYGAVTWDTLSAATGLSTGAIAKQFKTKADIWRAAMGCEPPGDGVLRYGEDLDDALRDLVEACDGQGQEEIAQALAKAQQLLDKVDALRRPPQ
jgi:AcrR family transcriptional regulator